MSKPMIALRRAALMFAAVFASLDAQAQAEVAHAAQGPYLVAAIGSSQYEHDCFLWGGCLTGHGTLSKFGGGYRFGVTSVEGWALDFGRATLGGDSYNAPSTVRMRALVVGAAWTARFGPSFEFTWRVGGAEVRHEGANASTADTFGPYFGMSGGWRVSEAATVELGYDILRGRGGDSVDSTARAFSLGLRFQF